jgi:lipoate-protein ligase B
MKELTEQRDENTPDELWLLQHQDVLTQGQAGKPEHILMPATFLWYKQIAVDKSLGMVLVNWLLIYV